MIPSIVDAKDVPNFKCIISYPPPHLRMFPACAGQEDLQKCGRKAGQGSGWGSKKCHWITRQTEIRPLLCRLAGAEQIGTTDGKPSSYIPPSLSLKLLSFDKFCSYEWCKMVYPCQ
jgi:hypothetical protein